MTANASFKLTGHPGALVQHHLDAALPRIGASISNLKGIYQSRHINVGLGTLGFLAVKRNAPDGESLVLVSNRHVLFANGAEHDEIIFQPDYEEHDDHVIFDAPHLNAIAKIDGEGLCGHFSFAYPGEPEEPYYIDCATASLLLKQNKNPQRMQGRVRHFAKIARVHPLDTLRGRELKVRLLGRPDSTWGKIIDSTATVETIHGELCRNTLIIEALPDRHGVRQPFSRKGDSGALLVDQHQRAVGLLWGNHMLDPYVSYACHIHPVLSFLQIIPWCFDFCAPQSSQKD
ncbi:MAG: hypothetical protein LZF85_07825 [Nitrosomonas sp.]|uniref:hypothetical protein n=1 Tax=Nitrosomonas sp. TaxID=42353 RepID=UPI0025D60055|nr:hypothetical protein [Nitrosomonas sp.]UJP01706.1 MAG: hypothetical protein LZF85_07825 [Nitrosomonas sp.]